MVERGAGRGDRGEQRIGGVRRPPPFLSVWSEQGRLERVTNAMHTELSGRGVSFNTLRIDETVPTEMYRLSDDLGAVANPVPVSGMYTPLQVAAALVWMVRQPASWSGKCIGFEDLRSRWSTACSLRPNRPSQSFPGRAHVGSASSPGRGVDSSMTAARSRGDHPDGTWIE